MNKAGRIRNIILILSLFVSSTMLGQLVTLDPSFPTDGDAVEITFNAALGSGGLAGYTGDVYAHTGVITDNSTSGSDWKYVVTDWGENTPATKLTNIGGDMYTLELGPSIREYYGVPAGETILQMAFVFRSEAEVGGSWLEGKTDTGGDIFIDVYEAGLNVSFITPAESHLIVDMSDQISVQIEASLSDSVALYKNNTLVSEVAGTQLQATVTVDATGKTYLVAKAWNATQEAYDSTYYFVMPQVVVADPPVGTNYGINYIDDQTVILCLHAPMKNNVFAIGDFCNWELEEEYLMKRTASGGKYWIQIDNLTPGQEYIYQYLVNGELFIADPYTEKVSDPWNDHYIEEDTYPGLISYPAGKTERIASVFQTAQTDYTWTMNNFTPPAKETLVIYELLVRDFTDARNYKTLIDSLTYLKYLGVNAIELMPVNEFEGNLSWGYNPSFYFAADKYYGPKEMLKEFIDSCHVNGIAVIMDLVPNHAFGQNTMAELYWDGANSQPAGNNPWFNSSCPHEPNCWGNDWNHESEYTVEFFDRVNKYWLEEFKFDGFRFDFTKGLTNNTGDGWNYDADRIAILKHYADEIWNTKQDAYVILEHWCDNSEEKELANYGFMLWGNSTHDFQEAAMGYSSDFDWSYYANRGWNNPHLVSYMESHDEERLMYKNLQWGAVNGTYSTKDLGTALDRMELAAHFFLPVPGPKMIWQFGELGYDETIDLNGRTGVKPTHWDYFNQTNRNHLFHVYKGLINLKKNYPAFSTSDLSFDSNTMMKRINLNHASMNVTILGNFDVSAGDITPKFQSTGWWYDYWTGDSINVSDVNATINLEAGEYKLYTDVKLPQPVREWMYIGIEEIETSSQLLSRAYPNPSSDGFTIAVGGVSPGDLSVEVFSYSGQRLWSKDVQVGTHGMITVNWNGKSFNGEDVATGIYFCRIVNDGKVQNVRLVKL